MARFTEDDLKKITARPGYRERLFACAACGQPAARCKCRPPSEQRKQATDAASKALSVDLERKLRAGLGVIEAMFELQVIEAKLSRPHEFQHKALPKRRFRVDVGFPALYGTTMMAGSHGPLDAVELHPAIAFEVQGNVHRIQHQFYRDMLRHNALTEAGWHIYYVSGQQVRDGSGIALVKRIIGTA